jgi:methylated-DNA-protein-cysteine methyltransferase-like protein
VPDIIEQTFAQQVYAVVRRVPRGRVITYGWVARLLDAPRHARQVGWAMAATPDQTPRIPAHRVVNARGEISPGGDHERRRALLVAEGVVLLPDGRVELDVYLWLPHAKGPSRRRGLTPATDRR